MQPESDRLARLGAFEDDAPATQQTITPYEQWRADVPDTDDPTNTVPTFPREYLPAPVRTFAEAVATSTQTPIDLPAMMITCAVASAVGAYTSVRFRSDHAEHSCVFGGAIAGTSVRKSGVMQYAFSPLQKLEELEQSEARVEVAKAASRKRVAEDRLKRARETAVAAKDDAARAKAMEEVDRLSEELAEMPDAVLPRRFLGDSTPEKVIAELQHHALTIAADEDPIFGAMSRYTDSPQIDHLCTAYSGGYGISRSSKSGGDTIIKDPHLTIALCVQPSVIESIKPDSPVVEKALIGRFDLVRPKSNVGFRDCDPPPVPPSVSQAYADWLMRLAAQAKRRPRELTLSADARAVHVAFAREVEAALRPSGPYARIAGWAGKAVGRAARYAALLHVAEESSGDVIDASSMERAVTLTRYLAEHAKVVAEMIGADRKQSLLRRVIAWAADRGGRFTSRDMQHALHGLDKAAGNPLLAELVKTKQAWLHKRPAGPKGGRPTAEYELHPSLLVSPPNGSVGFVGDSRRSASEAEAADEFGW